jgi:hypothetical protein
MATRTAAQRLRAKRTGSTHGHGSAIRSLATGEGIQYPSFTVAQLTGTMSAANNPRRIVWVSNGNAGAACLAVSDGTNWLRIALGAAVAAT